LLCKQGYECLEFADNAIVDGAYTYNTITAAIYFEVHNQFHIVKIQIVELLCCGIFSGRWGSATTLRIHTVAYTQRVTDAGNYATGTSECTNLVVLIKLNFQTQKSIHSFRSLAHNMRSPYNNNNKIGAAVAAGPFSSSQVQQPATLSLQLRPMHTLLYSSSCSLRLLQST
jgi:hypothetical protein